MTITSGPAQMIIPGAETGAWYVAQWLLHNDDPVNEIYLDITPNIASVPGSSNFILPPGASMTLTGQKTFWARTAEGTTADLHLIPTAFYGAPGAPATVTGASAG